MTQGEPDELEKIAQLAVKRGYWDARAALEGVAQARAHTTGPQKVFLKRLLERRCGLTYDELARLEKEALAPPATLSTPKPLPRLGAGKPAPAVDQSLASSEVVIPRAPEKPAPAPPPPTVETYTPPPRQEEIIATAKKLPKLGSDPKKDPPPSQSPAGTEIVTPKPLPRLGTPKRPKPEDEVPPSP